MVSLYAKLKPEQQGRIDELWEDFKEMWMSQDTSSMKFVLDFVSQEIQVRVSDCEKVLDELFHDEIANSEASVITSKVTERRDSLKDTQGDLRVDLVANLIKVKYARERKILYGEVLDLSNLDADSLKVTHPRLYFSALQDADALMKGIDPVDNFLFINEVSTGLVRDIVDTLRGNSPLSVTTIIRLMKRRYSTWNTKVRTTLEWLVQQGLVSKVGVRRYTLRQEDENGSFHLSATEQRIIACLDSKEGKNYTTLYRDMGVINHPALREELKKAVMNLEDRGYIFRGAYNRLLKSVEDFKDA